MTVSEKHQVLTGIERRFDCGSWDDLDVTLLLQLSLVAVNSPVLSTTTDSEFATVEHLRQRREAARQLATKGPASFLGVK